MSGALSFISGVLNGSTGGGGGGGSGTGGSLVVNASTSTYLSIPANSAFTLGTNNHTIEFWMYQTARGLYDTVWNYNSTASTHAVNQYYFNTGTSQFYVIIGNGAAFLTGTNLASSPPPMFFWHHYAIVRNGSTITLYIDGVAQAGPITVNSQNITAQNGAMWINGPYNTQSVSGYITNFRIVNGTAVYTSNFTPPTQPLTAITNTVLLMSETTSGGLLTDSSSNNWTVTSNSSSSSFNGTSSYCTLAYSTSKFDWFTTNYNFTIECWVYPTSFTGWYSAGQGPALVGNMAYNSNTQYWGFGPNASGQIVFYYISQSANYVTSTATISTGSWSHIAMTRTGTTITLYVNGVKDTQATISGTPQSSTGTTLTIGAYNSNYITGYVSNLRVVNSATAENPSPVYVNTFTPPTVPLIRLTNNYNYTTLLLPFNFNAGGVYDTSAFAVTVTSSNITSVSSTPFPIRYNSLTPFATTPPSRVTTGLLFNLDMQNYVSGNNWPDTGPNNYTFTWYNGATANSPPTVTNSGTSTAYFTTSSNYWAWCKSGAIMPTGSYTKGIVIRGNGSTSAPFGSYFFGSAESYDTFWANNGGNIITAGNHQNGSGSYWDVTQTQGNETNLLWYYLSVSCDTVNGWSLYVNGQLVGQSPPTASKPASTPVIGATGTSPGANASIAAAHTYNIVLTPAQHLQNAQYWLSRYSGSTPA